MNDAVGNCGRAAGRAPPPFREKWDAIPMCDYATKTKLQTHQV